MSNKRGFDAPNHTQVPNDLFALMPAMGEAELKVTLAIARKTFGWHKKEDEISLTQLQRLTGLSRQGVLNGINDGVARGTIVQIRNDAGPFSYSLAVNEVDQGVVNEVDQGVVNEVDPQKKVVNKEEEKDTSWAFREYESIFHETVVSIEIDYLREIAVIYSRDDLVEAMRVTKRAHTKKRIRRKVAYTHGILQDWALNGRDRTVKGRQDDVDSEGDLSDWVDLSAFPSDDDGDEDDTEYESSIEDWIAI